MPIKPRVWLRRGSAASAALARGRASSSSRRAGSPRPRSISRGAGATHTADHLSGVRHPRLGPGLVEQPELVIPGVGRRAFDQLIRSASKAFLIVGTIAGIFRPVRRPDGGRPRSGRRRCPTAFPRPGTFSRPLGVDPGQHLEQAPAGVGIGHRLEHPLGYGFKDRPGQLERCRRIGGPSETTPRSAGWSSRRRITRSLTSLGSGSARWKR